MEYWPSEHDTQVDAEVAPVALEEVPASHKVQLADPGETVKLPGAHTLQEVDPGGAYFPSGHTTHVDTEMAPIELDEVPLGQGEQLDDPEEDE